MNVEVLVISLSSPMLIGIYENSKLVDKYELEGKTSDILPAIFQEILKKYKLENLYYVNGPGSYMAIKVAYVFLKTLSISKSIGLYSVDGFSFNSTSPIKALGKKYFFKQHDGTIKIDFLDNDSCIKKFELPKNLEKDIFSNDSLPNYNLPAI